ncbi:transposase-like protein [Paenibacillus wynnii]|nr:transposase-like protein [Paenibacillus wynnii]
MPRDRNGDFQTHMFEPYQRRDGWLEKAVIQMYKSGIGTRDVARFIESMFGSHYSPSTVSNITATVLEDIQQWQMRPLQKRYSVIYLDGLYVKLKRSTVAVKSFILPWVSTKTDTVKSLASMWAAKRVLQRTFCGTSYSQLW